jgi:hypothetical protein
MPTPSRSRVSLVACAVLLTLTAAALPATAQVIHLPAAHKRPLPRCTVILSISSKDTTVHASKRDNARAPLGLCAIKPAGKAKAPSTSDFAVRTQGGPQTSAPAAPSSAAKQFSLIVDDGNIFLQAPSQTGPVPLGNRTVLDVVNQLRVSDTTLRFTSDYPLYPASYIGTDVEVVGDHIEVLANSDDPDLRIGFGVVLALQPPGTTTQTSGIMTQTGFQLDIVGSHQLYAPISTDLTKDHKYPEIYSQFRLGLNGDQQIQLRATDSGSTSIGSTTDSQFEAALGQADQVALSGQVDFEWSRWNPKITFALTPSYAVSWTRPEAPPLPRVNVAGVSTAADSVFSAAAVARTQKAWAQVEPLSEFGLMLSANFLQHHEPLYYAGAGVMKREVIQPHARFRLKGSPATPDPESLDGYLSRDYVNVWRAVLGARLAGVLDLRVDASGSIGKELVQPLLRVLIARAFPIAQ